MLLLRDPHPLLASLPLPIHQLVGSWLDQQRIPQIRDGCSSRIIPIVHHRAEDRVAPRAGGYWHWTPPPCCNIAILKYVRAYNTRVPLAGTKRVPYWSETIAFEYAWNVCLALTTPWSGTRPHPFIRQFTSRGRTYVRYVRPRIRTSYYHADNVHELPRLSA